MSTQQPPGAPTKNEHPTGPSRPPRPPRENRGTGRSWGALVPRVPVGLVVLLLVVAPLFLQPYGTTMLTRVLVFALLAVSLDLLVGITGLPSLGHAAYFGVGAYAAGWVSINITSDGPTTLLVAAIAGAIAAAATGWLAVRSGGVFFLMLTLAIGEILGQLAESWDGITGGSNGLYGIPAVTVFGTPLANAGFLYWFVLVGFSVGFCALWAIASSPFGDTLRGIHDNEARMRALGYNTFRYKYAAFVIAGCFAGLAGGLLAAQQRLVTPEDLGFTIAALILLAVVIGGAGTLWGACLGAALVVVVRDYIGADLDGHGPLLLGAVFVLVVYLMPRGFAGIVRGKRESAP